MSDLECTIRIRVNGIFENVTVAEYKRRKSALLREERLLNARRASEAEMASIERRMARKASDG